MRKFIAGGEAVTPVPTAFLAKDMLDAPSDYVKVYLYGLYLSGVSEEASDVSMENKLHMKSSEIDQAIRYWADRGLIHMETTNEGNVYTFHMSADSGVKREPFPYAAFNLRARDVMGRDLSAAELKRLYVYMEEDNLPQELVLRLLEYCVAIKGKSVSIKYVDKVEETWVQKGVATLEDAQVLIEEHQALTSGARQIMRQMGLLGKAPGQTELDYYNKWTGEWGFTHEGILAAMDKKEFSKSSPFKYLDTILAGYREQGALRAQQIVELSTKTENRNAQIKEILSALNYKSLSVTPSHIKYYTKWQKEGFSMPIILLACKEVVKDGYMKMEKVDQYLNSWKEKGFLTETLIQKHLARQNETEKLVKQVFDIAGITMAIKDKDLQLYSLYAKTHRIDHQAILYASEISSLGDHPRSMLYGTLKRWAEAGVHTLNEAMKYEAGRFNTPRKAVGASYPQRMTPEGVYADQRGAMALRELEKNFADEPDF